MIAYYHASASMPASVRAVGARYANLYVVEFDPTKWNPEKMVNIRSRCFTRILATYSKLNCGRTAKCAFGRAMAEVEARWPGIKHWSFGL